MTPHADIEMAICQVRTAEAIVRRQRKIVVGHLQRGNPTEMAENLLDTYEHILADYRAHLALLLKMESADPL